MNLFSKPKWLVVNCLTGVTSPVEHFPFAIGSGEGADLRLNGQGVAESHCAITKVKGQGLCLMREDPNLPLLVDGEPVDVCMLLPELDYTVRVGNHLLVVRGARHADQWLQTVDCSQWLLHDAAANRTDGPLPFEELCRFAKTQQRPTQAVVYPGGLSKGFLLHDAYEVLAALTNPEGSAPAVEVQSAAADEPELLTCPVCWLRFDIGDIMHVAAHDSLRGDPVLGEDAPQRFLATRFNDVGQALDALGLPCTEIACPHCRRVLPAGFAETTHHIISLVGDQSAGKSYYLSVLLNVLPAKLFDHFSVVFQDADPAGNAILNQMKQTLFGAKSPEGARLIKTQLEGIMYERLPRYGRTVALPKPFVFSVSSAPDSSRHCSLIFYDNAGEHFQPGRDSMDSPGAQHVASSAGILFLFDPFNNPDFRQRIADRADPQLETQIVDQQSVILSEMKVRLAKLLKRSLSHRVSTPMAVLIGKCDAWLHLLPEVPRYPLAEGALDLDAIQTNSDQLRTFLKEICPTIVANAESVSSNVRYFAISSFGHAPVKVGPGDYVPDPRRLKPFQVEVPIVWILSRIAAELVGTRSAEGAPLDESLNESYTSSRT